MLTPRDERLLLELSRVIADLARDSVKEDCSEIVTIASELSLNVAATIRMSLIEGQADALVQMLIAVQDFTTKYKYVPPPRKKGREGLMLYGGRWKTKEQIERLKEYQRGYSQRQKEMKLDKLKEGQC